MVLLLEHRKLQEVKRVPAITNITKEEFENAKRLNDYIEGMGADIPFNNKVRFWMKQVCKFYMRNNKSQGYTRVDWEKFEVMKRR